MALPDGLPPIDIESVAAAQAAVREAVRAGALSSAHDIAEGGLAVALAECCLAGGTGARIELTDADGDAWTTLFGEGAGGFVVSGAEDALRALAATTPVAIIGTVGGDTLTIRASGCLIEASVVEMTAANSALAAMFA
jgi:phosphoribosylformylglycinamidine synthase